MIEKNEIQKRLIELLGESKLKPVEIAKELGISQYSISKMMEGKNYAITWNNGEIMQTIKN